MPKIILKGSSKPETPTEVWLDTKEGYLRLMCRNISIENGFNYVLAHYQRKWNRGNKWN